MKTPGQRGTFGDWLTRARTQRYATQADALHDFERLAGLRITPSQYAQWESGSRVPRADNPKVKSLYDFFGSRPEDETPSSAPPPGDYAALLAAMAAQTEAITTLVAELRAARGSAQELDELRAVVDRLVEDRTAPAEPSNSDVSGLDVPQGRAE